MIVPMKKITVIAQSKDADSVLKALAGLGALHVEHENLPVNDSVASLEERYKALSKAISALPEKLTGGFSKIDPESLAHEILNLEDEKEILIENLKKVKRDIQIWKDWGDFDPEFIEDLSENNIWIRLCKITKKELGLIPEGAIVEQIFKKGNILYCAVFSNGELELGFETLALPEKSLDEMAADKENYDKRLREIDNKLNELSKHRGALLTYQKKLGSLIEFNKVMAGIGRFETLSYVKGYCPAYKAESIEGLAKVEKWGLLVEEPGESDNVPTLIKNPKWIGIISPIFKAINILPGYQEVDISPVFVVFFLLFFGMLIGDAGYGLIFLILASILKNRFKGTRYRTVFALAYFLSACSIIWGIMTGTFFGQTNLIGPLVPYFTDDKNVQGFCFFIGALQLSIAHLWKFARKFPSLKALSDIGWVFILWGAYFLAKALIIGRMFPEFCKLFFIIGASLVALFTNPAKNIFKSIGLGLGDFALKAMSSFTDIVSYIRLFAVGVAGAALANSFNQIAQSMWDTNLFMSIGALVILFFGHSLNIILGMLAILVHGVRLNILEFASHLDMEWSGIEYEPFKEA